jgi:hypothetical protein
MTSKLTPKEQQIFNSFGILSEFKSSTWSPRPWGRCINPRYKQSSRVKVYTEEEIFVYQMKQIKQQGGISWQI